MQELTRQLLVDIASISPGLSETFQDSLGYWAPEDPPATTIYADVGRRLVDDFQKLSPEEKSQLSSIIDLGMTYDDERGTSVATGLIEAVVARANRAGTWQEIRAFLGPLATAHADAWSGDDY